jgi:hypothetical protein
MYSINPGLAGPLVDEHVAELRRSAACTTAGRAAVRAAQGAPRGGWLRRKAGWALVSLGLRLVMPRRSAVALRGAR